MGDEMDKCIKVELPTGEILLKSDNGFYKTVTERCNDAIFDYTGTNMTTITKSNKYDGWVWISFSEYHDGDCFDMYRHAKVIAQYGDEFPV